MAYPTVGPVESCKRPVGPQGPIPLRRCASLDRLLNKSRKVSQTLQAIIAVVRIPGVSPYSSVALWAKESKLAHIRGHKPRIIFELRPLKQNSSKKSSARIMLYVETTPFTC